MKLKLLVILLLLSITSCSPVVYDELYNDGVVTSKTIDNTSWHGKQYKYCYNIQVTECLDITYYSNKAYNIGDRLTIVPSKGEK